MHIICMQHMTEYTTTILIRDNLASQDFLMAKTYRYYFQEKVVELDEHGNPIKKKRGRKPKEKKPKAEKPDTRHKLRKIIENSALDEKTVKAEQDEKERRERLEEIEKQEKLKAEKDGNKDELVLQHEPRVNVHSKIARRLKPHQLEGIKFMYANMVETVAKSTESSGEGKGFTNAFAPGPERPDRNSQ